MSILTRVTRQNSSTATFLTRHLSSAASKLHASYTFKPPSSLTPEPQCANSPPIKPNQRKPKPKYRPPSSLDPAGYKRVRSNDLPFDFRFSYTESSAKVRPIGLREPKYSPFGPGRLDRKWTGVCAPAVDPTVESLEAAEDPKLEEKRKMKREMIQGKPLTSDERKALVSQFERSKTNRHVNLGRDGLTHNMLNVIQNHWKFAEAVRIKCMGVPTMDMKNICTQLEDKTFGKVIFRHGAKNGYYAFLVPMVRDAFLSCELVRIDCEGLERKDYKKIGCKLRDMVPCIPVTFENEQVVVWRGKDYKPPKDGYFLKDRESFDDDNGDLNVGEEQQAM
ncbi:CRS2-associated factor 1, mitochondrial isoform X2 [Phaseolus vulgaris]|uniref:CRS2-associated factor 1, mitochondrial isoform X2 n=1 Tax=Phaseolus vulgaris TaxID=3885 RepID=UPI0035CBE112